MKKIVKILKTSTARMITIPSDYFKIHEAHQNAIVEFIFYESADGVITLTPVREILRK